MVVLQASLSSNVQLCIVPEVLAESTVFEHALLNDAQKTLYLVIVSRFSSLKPFAIVVCAQWLFAN